MLAILRFEPGAWDFEADPVFQEKLDWIERFVREELIPLEAIKGDFSEQQWAWRLQN